jgi:predicted signal transduction protein with EAL and GGDEF domain/DNA-binding response OmpR family regulator
MTLSNASVRVLLIDDDPAVRARAVRTFQGTEFDVIEAGSGAQALARIARSVPDVVVLDLDVHDLDGFQLCRKLRSTAPAMPIIVIMSVDDSESIRRAFDAGATDFYAKPVSYSLLVHRLRFIHRASAAVDGARQSAARLARAHRIARISQWELDVDSKHFRWTDDPGEFGHSLGNSTDARAEFVARVYEEDRLKVERVFDAGQPHQLEFRFRMSDGELRTVHQQAELVIQPSGKAVLEGSVQDITELRDAEQQAHDLANYDPLTRLPNRAQVRRFLEEAIERAQKHDKHVAVLSIDLDAFNRVNDTLGHSGGDELLREVAGRVASCVRWSDAILWTERGSTPPAPDSESAMTARLGGDTFVVVLADMRSPEDAAAVGQRIVDKLERSYRIGDSEVFVTASVGVATYPSHASDAETLLDRSAVAVYRGKHDGQGNLNFYLPAMQEQARERLELERILRAALARSSDGSRGLMLDAPEFYLVYQPKVHIPSGHILGAEALLRWESSERGAISPAKLIPLAEATGLIVPLGAWVLKSACVQAAAWSRSLGRELRVAVNVSPRQFREPGFIDEVRRTIQETGVDPALLELELTEGMVMENTKGSLELLEALKALGVRISLDDFGTGYSSLSYLMRLPIDSLKIDRSFIVDSGARRGATVTTAIISLARGLGLDVVVEGVETQEQLAFVESQAPLEVQGFVFAKPMRANAIPEWLDTFKRSGPLSKHRAA